MRPAQKAPENDGRTERQAELHGRFNEAGAKSAGKLCRCSECGKERRSFNEAGAKSAGKLWHHKVRLAYADMLQ